LYEKLNSWFGLAEMAKTARVPIFYLFTEGTQIQMYSQVLSYCHQQQIIVNRPNNDSSNESYQGATVLDPVPGRYDKVLSFDFASLYPSIMIAFNIDYSTLVLDDSIPDEDCHVFEWKEHVNCEHDENRKRKKDGSFSTAKKKVFCADRRFRFLKQQHGIGIVPTLLNEHLSARKKTRSQIAQNENKIKECFIKLLFILHSKQQCLDSHKSNEIRLFVNSITYLPDVLDQFQQAVEFYSSDSFNSSSSSQIEQFCKFSTLEHYVISLLSDNDLSQLLDTKHLENDVWQDFATSTQEICQNTIQFNQVLDKRQSSYKICANSMYGAMGVKSGLLPLPEGAMTITYRGRWSIKMISTHIPQKYNGITVYGDTDSSMIYFPSVQNNADAVELAIRITTEDEEMQQWFPKPMKLEFEKIYEKYLILSKKRYIAQVANTKGQIIDFVKKGVVLIRRDNCKLLREIYLKTAMSILDKVDRNLILDNIVDSVLKMFRRKCNVHDFVITKSLSKDIDKYNSSKSLPSHVQLAKRMIERGENVEVGSRIEYLFTTIGRSNLDLNQGDKVECLEFFEKWMMYLRIDYLYYLDKQMKLPIDEILSVGLGEENFMKRLHLYHQHYFCICQHILSLRSNIVVEDKSDNNSNTTNTKKNSKSHSNDFFIALSKNASKKSWTIELDYMKSKPNTFSNHYIHLLKRIRGIRTSDENAIEKEKNKTEKEKKMDDIANVFAPTTYYHS
jgi:DNA polymerase elongation subunit (family B)